MQIAMRPIESVKPYEHNPRKNDGAVEAVARSIREFGFRQPIVVDGEGVIVVGHTRWKAAQQLGLKQVPVHVASELSAEQARAYRIADNQTATIADWDAELLPVELGALKDLDFDLSLLGFDDDELKAYMAPPMNEGLVDPDDVPAPPDAAITQPGDLIIMGQHRLLCGDSSSAADVDRLLDGQVIHLCNTDPPYNVKVEPRSNNAIAAGLSSFQATSVSADRERQNQRFMKALRGGGSGSGGPRAEGGVGHHQQLDLARHPGKAKGTHAKLRAKDRPLANDFVSDEAFAAMLSAWFGNIARVLVPGGGFYIWGGYANVANYPPALKASGLYFSQTIIWDKQHPVLTRKDFMGAHEWCFYGWREGAGHTFYGPANIPDLWHVKKVNPQSMVHLTEKPVELAARAMQYSSRPGEHVLDLFGGSGSTLIAVEQQGRRAYLIEIDPLYCDVIVQRWERFTGKTAERVAAVGGARSGAGVGGASPDAPVAAVAARGAKGGAEEKASGGERPEA
ncbi:MAG: DNA modification methylase [Steroidobacteraceae bacterium]